MDKWYVSVERGNVERSRSVRELAIDKVGLEREEYLNVGHFAFRASLVESSRRRGVHLLHHKVSPIADSQFKERAFPGESWVEGRDKPEGGQSSERVFKRNSYHPRNSLFQAFE